MVPTAAPRRSGPNASAHERRRGEEVDKQNQSFQFVCSNEFAEYKILGPISDKRCSELAPNIGVNCKKGYLISVGDYSGGSMGWDMSFGIYGFFDLPNFGPSIVPLKFFPNRNEGLNFLDGIKGHTN